MQFDVKQAVATALTIGMFIMLLNMIGNGPLAPATQLISGSPEESVSSLPKGVEKLEESRSMNTKNMARKESRKLWGKPGPILEPCWSESIKTRTGRTWGYVLVRLSNGPHYHRSQVADAIVVARYLGATLLLPTIKEAVKEPNSNFDKIYDVNAFITSLEGVVRVVGRVPDDARVKNPTIVKVPYKVTPEYIEENIQTIFKQKAVIQLVSFFPTVSLKVEETQDEEIEAIRCLVTYKALQFHSQVQKLGERVMNRVREAGESAGGRFIAVDLRVDLLKQKGCSYSENSKNKKCFDANDVGMALRGLGFPSDTAIYLTQPRWDQTLDPLKDMFPNVYTKEYSMPFNEEKQILYSGKTQFEKAIDFYICTHSDVFVPAISGMFYANVAGQRIVTGKTQMFVPMVKKAASSQPKISAAISRYVTKKDHPVYSCFCEASSKNRKLEGENGS